MRICSPPSSPAAVPIAASTASRSFASNGMGNTRRPVASEISLAAREFVLGARGADSEIDALARELKSDRLAYSAAAADYHAALSCQSQIHLPFLLRRARAFAMIEYPEHSTINSNSRVLRSA